MDSLWLSFPDDLGGTGIREPIRRFLDGRLPREQVDDVLAVAAGLVRENPRGGELILSHRDDTVLVEVLRRTAADPAPATSAGGHVRGAHPAGTGSVVWVSVPVPPLGQPFGD
ncbi:hypothetical protein Ait01nite_034820 [Actinoplanes italicus]|uniref:Anti-sigma regulatory factor (Ser/Thr protein kinase) n=1 Tax=Actinoplanes italicus TaxID=113567 RepID=A0A2T0K8Z0_9ACTN|nr:hypothetical protein [Actinoplanes italicus]PRX19549.1 hypothetical protein CLV67_110301 [Actinoplanes italicus]GIE30437.1 hypothetical protein Ait01nite_034820 [Actinoplanes italicus]